MYKLLNLRYCVEVNDKTLDSLLWCMLIFSIPGPVKPKQYYEKTTRTDDVCEFVGHFL
jgi:hypothetical protein